MCSSDLIRVVVAPPALQIDWTILGFEQVDAPESPMLSASIARGMARLSASQCRACIIALSDMPFVPISHFRALAEYSDAPVVATGSGQRAMVPARFARDQWDRLSSLSGDTGARALLRDAPVIDALSEWLCDIEIGRAHV